MTNVSTTRPQDPARDLAALEDLRRSLAPDVNVLGEARSRFVHAPERALADLVAADQAALMPLEDAANRHPFLLGRAPRVEQLVPDAVEPYSAAMASLDQLGALARSPNGTVADATKLLDGAITDLGLVDARIGTRLQQLARLIH